MLRFVSQSVNIKESKRIDSVQRAQNDKCNYELVKEVLHQVRHNQAQLDRLIDVRNYFLKLFYI